MKVPLLDLKSQYRSIQTDIDVAVREQFAQQHFVLGASVSDFEAAFAHYVGSNYAIGVASGTDALLLSLKACDIGDGDEVITSPFTFFATAGAIANTGARPVFVDIDPVTFTIDPARIEAAITEQTRAIIPVHLFGQCADMTRIHTVAERYGLIVIEDAAQAVGSLYRSRMAGTFGMTGCFSFFPSKNLGACGDAGMIISDDERIARRLRSLRVHGEVKRYVHTEVGFNSRLDALQAVILQVKLNYLDQWLEERRKKAARYSLAFQQINDIVTPSVPNDYVHSYHQYTLRAKRRDELLAYLTEHGIGCGVYYPVPLHVQECFSFLGYRSGDLPHTEKASDEVISLPVSPELTPEQQDYVIETIKQFYS